MLFPDENTTPARRRVHVVDRIAGARTTWRVERRAWLVAQTGELALWGAQGGQALWFGWGIQ